MNEKGIYKSDHTMLFIEKTRHEHLTCFIKFFSRELLGAAVLVGVLWGFTSILTVALNNRVPPDKFALPVLIIAFTVTFYRACLKYRSFTPEALKRESETVKTIFRKQRCGWQYAIAWHMMTDRINATDLTLERIENGAEFIEPKEPPIEDYFRWLKLRPVTLKRLTRAVAIQCTSEFPRFFSNTKPENHLDELKNGVIELSRLYGYAKKYEIECHQIIPQDPFVEVHEMTYGWTDSIREGVNIFMGILHDLSSLDKKALRAGMLETPNFTIAFPAPKNVENFCKRLDDIDKQINIIDQSLSNSALLNDN